MGNKRDSAAPELAFLPHPPLADEFDELRLESFAANQSANAFYLKHRWREVRRYVDQDSGVEKIVVPKATGRTKHIQGSGRRRRQVRSPSACNA
jgi:hypothetical protein